MPMPATDIERLIKAKFPDAAIELKDLAGIDVHRRHTSAASCRFDGSDVDLLHVHHRLEGALGRRAIRIGYNVSEGPWGQSGRLCLGQDSFGS